MPALFPPLPSRSRLRRATLLLVPAFLFGAQPPAALRTYKQMSLAELMEVEITSVSRRPEKLSDVPSAVQIVTGDDIRRAGIRNLPEALRLLSNLQVAQVDSRQWAVSARGFNNTIANKLLVLLDGRTLYTPLFAGVFWDVQDTLMDDVDRIEVISGPGATQWGSNAVNGVINITTKNTKDTLGGLLIGGAGSEMRGLMGARYGGALGPNAHYRIYAKRVERDSTRLMGGGDARDEWHKTQGGFRVDWGASGPDGATLQGDVYDGRIGQLNLADIAVSGGNLLGRWRRTLGNDSELQVQAYYDHTYRRIPGSITETLRACDLDLQHRLPGWSIHRLMWGAMYRIVDDEVRNPVSLAFLPANVKREWWSGFLQDELTLVPDRLRAMLGIKAERNPYTGSEFQPSARLAWKVRPEHLVWAAVSRAVRTPSRIDREFFAPGAPPFFLAGGPNFESEKLIASELGYRAQPNAELGVSLSTFHHDYEDLRSVEPFTGGLPGAVILGNGLDGKSYGAELSLDYRVNPQWRLRLGYTEMRVQSGAKPWSADRDATGSPALDPNRQALLHSQLDLGREVSVDSVLRYVAPIGNQALPAYAELDLRLSWRPARKLELSLVGKNLLHRSHAEFGAPETRRRIERSVFAEVLWRF